MDDLDALISATLAKDGNQLIAAYDAIGDPQPGELEKLILRCSRQRDRTILAYLNRHLVGARAERIDEATGQTDAQAREWLRNRIVELGKRTDVRLRRRELMVTMDESALGLSGLDEDDEPAATDAMHALADRLMLDVHFLHELETLLRDKRQIVFYGPPGTGKTFVARALAEVLTDGVTGAVEIVQFHPSYAYEDFVEGFRPTITSSGHSGFVLRDGPLKQLAQRAADAPDQPHILIIDEMNRGNVAKVFGELYFLLEYRSTGLTLQYSAAPFSLPTNLWIIGTMNTADRSLALLDTALRRRFEFVPVMPDARDDAGAPLAGLRVSSGEQVIDIPRMLDAINQRVEALYDRDHCIGHAYFTPLAKVPDGDERLVALQQVFSTRILPLLEEYCFEDWEKIRLVLADNQKPAAAQFVRESADHEDDLARLFGGDHGLDSYATKRRYAVQEAAFSNPDAYIGIYQTLSA